MSSAAKNIVAELNKGDKLNGDNYEIWSMKIQYVLEEQKALEALNVSMTLPEIGDTPQHERDLEVYQAWKRKNYIARITLLSSMDNDIMREFRQYDNAKDMWSALKEKFGHTSVAKLRALTIKFDTYKKRPDHTMHKHLRHISNMVNELNNVGHVLTEEQQIQAVIRSLPQSWENMKMHLTHNVSIKTMEDAKRHLELEEERIGVDNAATNTYMASSSSKHEHGKKRKHDEFSQKKGKGKVSNKPKTNQQGEKNVSAPRKKKKGEYG